MSLSSTILMAQETAAPAAPGGGMFQLILIVFMTLIAMYLLFVLPRKTQEKKTQNMLNSLKKNDRVMLTCGLIGTVYSIDLEQHEIVLKVDEATNTKMRFSTGAIYFVYQDKDKQDKKEN
ncbi:MAG: preprotein translocase subunit YajC [Planctomycetia bacterium]|nr:preprotein translocase subunit YajC [Planctomycetia bacterium]